MNTQDVLDRITSLAQDDPAILASLTRWLDARDGAYYSEQYALRAEFNDECSCHPVYQTVDVKHSSLAKAIQEAAAHESPRSSFKVNLDDLRVERSLSEQELEDAKKLLADTRQARDQERAAIERMKKVQEVMEEIKRSKQRLESDRKDLNSEAIARREQAIAEKEQKLAAM